MKKFKLHGKYKKKIVIFDLDDTLIKTDAKIKVVCRHTGVVIKTLTTEEFNNWPSHLHDELDFDEFEDPEILRQGIFIVSVLSELRKFYKQKIPVAIVTARSSSSLVREFFLENGVNIHPSLVIAVSDPETGLNGSIAERKLESLHIFYDMGFRDFTFFDDNEENLKLSKEIEKIEGVSIERIVVEGSEMKKFEK